MISSFADIRNVSFSYDRKKPAVRDFSLSIPSCRISSFWEENREGVFVAIIGPNGSGKTTLMKMLAGILRPRSGTAEILGFPVTEKTDPAKVLAYVPQVLELGFSLSVLDFVLLGVSSEGRLGKVSRATVQKARDALRFLCIEDYAERDMLRLSGGERQKVILTKALAQETPAILLDEPMTHLDLAGQIEILDLLKKMSWEGKKILAIMHDINLAARYADYTVIMKDASLFAAGKTGEVITEENIRQAFSVVVRRAGDFFIPVKMF
ncbi:MAG: ABC transporter ATP-binding protein [Spirochaetaceae bacterium]|nr:ABC transporter ATP-binding protein [Spirochaetaceae bacterium]